MPITGKLLADFDSFYVAVDKAEKDLNGLAGGAAKVGPALDRMTTQGTTGLTTFHQGLSQADKTLNAFGVNIGSQLQAIKELGEASGKTATEIGAIGTAGLAAGAALAGWQVGRLIADFLDLDKAIGDATAKLVGFGDVAAQEAGAGADVLARASATAGRTITDFTEAMRINREEADSKFRPTYERLEEQISATQREVRNLDDATKSRIRTLLDAGASEQKVAEAMKVSVDVVKRLTEVDRLQAEQRKKNTQLAKERAAAETKLAEAIDSLARTEFRQLAALQASGTMIAGDVLPAVLKAENELGVQVDDVTLRVNAQTKAWQEGQTTLEQEIEKGRLAIEALGTAQEDAGKKGKAAGDEAAAGWERMAEAAAAAIKIAIPRGFSFEQAYRDAGLFVHDTGIGRAANVLRGSATSHIYNISVGSFYGTDRNSVSALAAVVGDEFMNRAKLARKF